MPPLLKRRSATMLAALALALLVPAAAAMAGGKDSPPNWKVTAVGTTVGPGEGEIGPDVDDFAGTSSHLGRFTGEGIHFLDPVDPSNPLTWTFEGVATYTAANGDELHIEYEGCIVGVDFTDPFPFEILAEVWIVEGGTGRLADATGGGVMTGGFTGVPGDLFFEIEGTLHPRGK